jgi:hypothetical protein
MGNRNPRKTRSHKTTVKTSPEFADSPAFNAAEPKHNGVCPVQLSDMSPVCTRREPPHSCGGGALQRSDTASPITMRFSAGLFLANPLKGFRRKLPTSRSKLSHHPIGRVSDFSARRFPPTPLQFPQIHTRRSAKYLSNESPVPLTNDINTIILFLQSAVLARGASSR